MGLAAGSLALARRRGWRMISRRREGATGRIEELLAREVGRRVFHLSREL